MGDVSVMARRLPGGHVQYGWSGNGGYCRSVGARLLSWYTDPDLVEYLFSLGQTSLIGKPGSEKGDKPWFETHNLTNEQCWLGKTERQIFSTIAFVDYGYFFDADNRWYYVEPGPFRIKIPLDFVYKNLDENGFEFDFLTKLQRRMLTYLHTDYINQDVQYKELVDAVINEAREKRSEPFDLDIMLKELCDDDSPMYTFYDNYRRLFDYFDDWIVIDSDMNIKCRKKEDTHIETIEW